MQVCTLSIPHVQPGLATDRKATGVRAKKKQRQTLDVLQSDRMSANHRLFVSVKSDLFPLCADTWLLQSGREEAASCSPDFTEHSRVKP